MFKKYRPPAGNIVGGFITLSFTLLSQTFSHLYNGSGFRYLFCSADGSLRVFRYVNYCVPLAAVKVTLIVMRWDRQWGKCDKLFVSVTDYFDEATFTSTKVWTQCHFQQGFGGI